MKQSLIVREIIDWLVHIALAVVFTLLVINYVGQFTIVQGNSMLPTLKNNDILVIEKLTGRFGEYKQGDIVVLKIPELLGDGKTYAIKRIIALGGQRVTIRDGSVLVDGSGLEEPYINGRETLAAAGIYDDMEVPEDCIYVLGDNRLPGASKDSRFFGPVNSERIAGKVVFRLFPFSDMGVIGKGRGK